MAQVPANINTDPYFSDLPSGMTKTTTPQGGTAYKDASGNLYLPQVGGGLKLSTPTLPANNIQAPGPGQGTSPVSVAQPTPDVPVTTTAPVATNPDGTPQKTAAQIQSEADALSSQSTDSSTGTRTSSTIESDFQKFLDNLSSNKPVAPDTNAETATQNAIPGGVNDLTTQLNTETANYQNLINNLQNEQAGEASKPGVVATIINGRMKMLSAEQSKALNDQKSLISSLTTSLKNANTAVQTFIKNKQTDYTTAEKDYEFQYTKALSMYQDELNQQDKAQTQAKANAQVIINSFKGSTLGVNSITDTDLANWQNLELQAGLPAGTIETAVENEMSITKFQKGSDGYMYVTGTDNTGVPYTARIEGSYGAGTGTAKQKLKDDTSKMSGALDAAKGTDGMVSNADWNAALEDWIAAGYSAAQFNTLFKAYKSTNK